MTEKGGTFGIDSGYPRDSGRNSLGADKIDPQPTNPNRLNPAIEAKMEHWKEMVVEKWNVFHGTKNEEKSIDDCKIEKNNKIKTLKYILEDISASPSKTEGQDERQKEISSFMEKLEKIEESSPEEVSGFLREIKELEEIKDDIHHFFNKNF